MRFQQWHVINEGDAWPGGISTGLILPCSICGKSPKFDFTVTDEGWCKVCPPQFRNDVICLPCFDRIATSKGIAIGDVLKRVQFTGVGCTVVMYPDEIYEYVQVGDSSHDHMNAYTITRSETYER